MGQVIYVSIGVLTLVALGVIGCMVQSALEIYKVDKSAIVHNLNKRKQRGNKKS